jgi:hypothetical protein
MYWSRMALIGSLISTTTYADPVPTVVSLVTPQSTFQTLLSAIQNRDADALENCFIPSARGDESGGDRLRADPLAWTELDALFPGAPVLVPGEETLSDTVGARFSARVDAPLAPPGGIGALYFQRTSEGWQLVSW